MPDDLVALLGKYREAVVQILGDRFVRMILFGSYARGDFNKNSDMDIMILADICPEEIGSYADKVYDVTYDFEMHYEMEINPSVQSRQIYEQWKKVYPFFNKNYVHTGLFPSEIGRSISKAAKIRHASDYDEFYIASKGETEKQIQTAKAVINLADDFLSEAQRCKEGIK